MFESSDIQALNEVKTLILESLKEWKNYKKRNARWSTAGVTRDSRNAQDTSNVYSQLSGFEDVRTSRDYYYAELSMSRTLVVMS